MRTQPRALRALWAFDAGVQRRGVELRTIGTGEKIADLIGCPVDTFGFAGGSAVEEIDEAPGQILGIGFEGSIGKQREKIAPDPG